MTAVVRCTVLAMSLVALGAPDRRLAQSGAFKCDEVRSG